MPLRRKTTVTRTLVGVLLALFVCSQLASALFQQGSGVDPLKRPKPGHGKSVGVP